MTEELKCSIAGCTRSHKARGWCATHYARWRRDGHPGEAENRSAGRPGSSGCVYSGCRRSHYGRGWCAYHYARVNRTGSPTPPGEAEYPGPWSGWTSSSDGYVVRTRRIAPYKRETQLQHRYVMEQRIGRPLLPEETVHHRNGVRSDNRLRNLELWSSSHPKGQRVGDKLKWAREIIALYGELDALT